MLDYPEHGPADIYSLGVPKNAQIIDNRPQKNTENLINEIQKRSDEYNVYNYTGSKSNIQTLYSVVKDRWPDLTIQNILDLADDKYAEYQLIYDGKTSFYRRANYSGEDYTKSLDQDMFQMDGIESLMNLTWCNPCALLVTGIVSNIKPEIITEDPNHVGLIGLRLIETVNTSIQRLPGMTIKESNRIREMVSESNCYRNIISRCKKTGSSHYSGTTYNSGYKSHV